MRVGVVQGAVVDLGAGFQLEDSAQTAAQIFGAFEADTRCRSGAAGHFGGVAVFAAALSHDAGIQDTVDGDVRLSESCGAGSCQHGDSDKGFFHYVFPSVVLLKISQ
jgi:hypothetical protein